MRGRFATVVLVALVSLLFSHVASTAKDGDTIYVKTLTFKDTTKRSGTWLFPPKDSYEKVVMLYTLKCDPATTQDQYPCGEWDYLTTPCCEIQQVSMIQRGCCSQTSVFVAAHQIRSSTATRLSM